MNVIFSTGGRSPHLRNTCAAIGIFDGVHRGHRYLLQQMLAAARRLKAQPIVITFFPHPAHVLAPSAGNGLRPNVKLGYLSSLADRLRLLEDLGVGTCLIIRFNKKFARIEPRKFIKDILVKTLGVKAIFVGDDFRFGKDRGGDTALFQTLAKACGYEMHVVPALKQGGKPISSTRIRKLMTEGKLDQAARLLGRPVALSGCVKAGSRRGKALGYPTANVAYEADMIPPKGVYVVRVRQGAKAYPAVANVGIRPSFKEKNPKVHLEVHILDFHKDIYGQDIQVQFLKKLRAEKTFLNPQHLIRQIQKDEARARAYFK